MKTYDQLVAKFSNDKTLVYRDMYIYPNNSCYRGQMKKKDETCKGKLSESTTNFPRNSDGRPSAVSEEHDEFFRHGYGIQYWVDGAHYEGYWSYNKAEG